MKTKVLFVLSLLFGLMFINAGLNKFFNYMPVPENIPQESMNDFMAMMEIKWLMPLLGAVEVLAGILIIVPKYRVLGAIMILPVMVGIILANTVVDTSGLPLVLVLTAILGWILYDGRSKYAGIIS